MTVRTKTMSEGPRILKYQLFLYKKDLISLKKKTSLKIVLPLPLNDTINCRKYTIIMIPSIIVFIIIFSFLFLALTLKIYQQT
jgi:hypothetical protein